MYVYITAAFVLCLIPWSYALVTHWGSHGCDGYVDAWVYSDTTHIFLLLASAASSYANMMCAHIMAAEDVTPAGQCLLDYRRVKALGALKLVLCYVWVWAFILNPHHGLAALYASALLLGACTIEGVLVTLVMLVRNGKPTAPSVRMVWSASAFVGVFNSLLVAAMSAMHFENCYAQYKYE